MNRPNVAGYELWDTASRNLLDDFDTESEALEAARAWIALNGPGSLDMVALTCVDGDGRTVTLAAGAQLEQRARAARPERGQLPA